MQLAEITSSRFPPNRRHHHRIPTRTPSTPPLIDLSINCSPRPRWQPQVLSSPLSLLSLVDAVQTSLHSYAFRRPNMTTFFQCTRWIKGGINQARARTNPLTILSPPLVLQYVLFIRKGTSPSTSPSDRLLSHPHPIPLRRLPNPSQPTHLHLRCPSHQTTPPGRRGRGRTNDNQEDMAAEVQDEKSAVEEMDRPGRFVPGGELVEQRGVRIQRYAT